MSVVAQHYSHQRAFWRANRSKSKGNQTGRGSLAIEPGEMGAAMRSGEYHDADELMPGECRCLLINESMDCLSAPNILYVKGVGRFQEDFSLNERHFGGSKCTPGYDHSTSRPEERGKDGIVGATTGHRQQNATRAGKVIRLCYFGSGSHLS